MASTTTDGLTRGDAVLQLLRKARSLLDDGSARDGACGEPSTHAAAALSHLEQSIAALERNASSNELELAPITLEAAEAPLPLKPGCCSQETQTFAFSRQPESSCSQETQTFSRQSASTATQATPALVSASTATGPTQGMAVLGARRFSQENRGV